MQITPSDPDIATIYRKISNGRLDLQPDFQRGEVWSLAKKQRLIDSILRGWHIPPIHVVQPKNGENQEVLDGQQRLVAIRDFMNEEFCINGEQAPFDTKIFDLNGFKWKDLPNAIKESFLDFTIRILTLTDYKIEEPGELFYRLNQPTNLTSAEQRNAFFGDTRQQVKELSSFMVNDLELNTHNIGFSNSRMAYDDIVSKFLITLEYKTLKKKITANVVTTRFRDGKAFEQDLIILVKKILIIFCEIINKSKINIKLNKASTLSWLLFIYKYDEHYGDVDTLIHFFEKFETNKDSIGCNSQLESLIYSVYIDRSSARVADTMSVILRDLSLWAIFCITFYEEFDADLVDYIKLLEKNIAENNNSVNEKDFENLVSKLNWGELL